MANRSGPATAIIVDGVAYLVDLGPGVVRRANAASIAKRIAALEPTKLRVAFITHLHSDHTVGYPSRFPYSADAWDRDKASAHAIDEKPLGTRERTTLLTIIAALAKAAKIDVSKPVKAGDTIAALISAMGYEVAPNTVAGHLRTLRKTLLGETQETPEEG